MQMMKKLFDRKAKSDGVVVSVPICSEIGVDLESTIVPESIYYSYFYTLWSLSYLEG